MKLQHNLYLKSVEDGGGFVSRRSGAFFRACLPVFLFGLIASLSVAFADNPPPVQTFYIPMPEDDLLNVLQTIENGTTWIPANQLPADPVYTYVTISVFSDNTIIYYDHWENGFDTSINNPLNLYHPVNNPGGTQIWGDGNPLTGRPPGFTNDVLNFGDVIRLENYVVSTNRSVINFDAGDKIAATKPIAVTWAGWASGSATLFAGANEIFDTTFWGTEYISPVGEDIFTDIPTAVGQMFEYTGFSIMAGAGGATIQIDANADGVFETTNTLTEGQAHLVNGGVNVGGRVISDRPVQVELLTGDIYEGYESRFFKLLPVSFWTSSSTTPVSTPFTAQGVNGAETTVWLYNPATTSIDVNYITRTGANLATNVLTIPGSASGGYLRRVIPNGFGARFVNTSEEPFYALATIDSTGTILSTQTGPGQNRTWDWGFTLVPEGSLTKQVLVGLGIGRDPTSGENLNENGAPIWVTPIGNGNELVTIYVDYDSDPSTGPFEDPNGNRYDAAYTARELDIVRIYSPDSVDQSGFLIYLLDDDVKLAAAWGSDPVTASAGQPGLDMGTGIPPLPQFVANKRSFLLIDEDGDGYISPGDVLEYRIIIDNTGRQPVVDLTAQDELPDSLIYITNSTFFITSSGVTNFIADLDPPADPFPLSGSGYLITNEAALPVRGTWQIGYRTRVNDFTNLPPGTVDLENIAIVGGVGLSFSNTVTTPIYARVGDYVWWDRDGDGFQTAGEPGINGVTVNLLTTNGAPVLDEIGLPITTVTANDTFGNPGWYRLTGITAGTYVVEFVLPTGYVFTTYNADGQGTAGTTNSTAQIPSGWTVPFVVETGETITTIDAGLLKESTIGNFVWLDVNGDGIQDAGEPGLNGVTVNLLDSNGDPVLDANNNPVSTVTTNDGLGNPGYYLFDGLYAGDYIVEFVLPADYAFTTQDADGQGLSGGANSDANPATGRTAVINLGVEDEFLTVAAGLVQGDLVLTKSLSPAAAGEGATVTYSISVSNAGPTLVSGIAVNEPLTNGLTYVTHGVSQGTYNSGNGNWDVGPLAVDAVATLTIEATVNIGTMDTAITNTARITAADMPDPDAGNNQDTAVLYVSSLEIDKESDVAVSVQPGGQITYTITVTNTGSATHTNIVVNDPVPPGTTYDPGSASIQLIPPAADITNTVYDSFSAQTYTNNNGTVDWAGAWQETGEADGPLAGDARVRADGWAEIGNNRTLTRAANLNGAISADLSFRVMHEELWETNNVRDEFNAVSYANNNGSVNWSGNWTEIGDDGAPGGGRIQIVGGRVRLRRCQNNEGIERTVNLSGYETATLTFDWETGNLNNNEYVLLYVVTNGVPVQLAQYGPGAASGAASFDISNYITPATTIRFLARQQNWNNNNDEFFFDNIDITFTRPLQLENNFLDEFNAQSYSNNDGSLNWNGDWEEGDPAGTAGPIGDYVGVTAGGRLFFHWAWVNDEWAMRSADLSEYETAVLRFDWETVGLTGGRTISVLISTNGAAPFIELEQLSGTATGSAYYDITEFMSNNTTIRFENQSINWASGNYAYFDNVEIIVRRPLITDEDLAFVEFTADGSSWIPVYAATGAISGTVTSIVDVAAYAAADSAVRFRTVGYTNTGAALLFDDVRIEYVTTPGGDSVGDPPGLVSGLTLGPGEAAIMTFSVTVDDPLDFMAVTNTAEVSSHIQIVPVPAVVIDPVVHADLGLGKAANVSVVNEGEPVVFTIAITNLSIDTAVTGVQVTDVYPSGFSYSNAVTSQGGFDSLTGVWSVGVLGIGGTATLDLTLVADPGSGGLFWTNTATITASDFADTNLLNNTASVVVLVRGADLALTKTVSNPAPNEETEISYTITLANLGPSDTTGVTALEPLTNGITYVSHSASQGSWSDATGIWNVGSMASGQVETLTITVEVDAGTVGTSITNFSAITASDQPDPNSGNNQDEAVIAVSGLRVTKVSDVMAFAYPGSNITYTIIVTNLGSTAHTGINVTDLLPDGTAYVPGSLQVYGPNITNENFRDEFNAQSYSNNDGSLNWNGDWTEGDPAGTAGPIGDYVGVTGDGRLFFHWAYVNDEWAMRSADLSGYESATYSFDWETVGLTGARTMSVLISTNGSPPFVELEQLSGTATGTAEYDITDYMSSSTTIRFENLSVNWASGNYAYFDNIDITVGQRVTNTVIGGSPPNLATNRSLLPGEYLQLIFDVTVDNPCAVTQIVNTVSVSSDQQVVPVTATVIDPVPYTDLSIVKNVSNPNPNESDTIFYTLTVNNLGPADATGVVVTDLLPAGVTHVTNTTAKGSYDHTTGLWEIGTLDNGDFAVLSITVTVDPGTAATSITNNAAITANDLADPNPGNDQDSAVITVIGVDIGLGKSVAPLVPYEKEQVVYTISVTNFGTDAATGVQVTDILPAPLSYISHWASTGSYATNTGVWTIGAMAALQVETLTLTALVPDGSAGQSITNTATVTGVDQTDTDPSNDSDFVVVVPEEPPLDIFKESDVVGSVDPGGIITYTITVTNQSGQTQTGVTVSDMIPTGVSLVPDSVFVYGPIATNSTFADFFDNQAYTNNNGNLNWTGNWVESEGDGPAAGDTRVWTDTGRGPYTLRFSGGNRTLARVANLGGYTNATLSFVYRRENLFDATRIVNVQASSNGTAGPWTTIASFAGPGSDGAYSSASYNISAYIATNTAIRFASAAANAQGDRVWFDDITITVPDRYYVTVAGDAPPNLASGYTLEPGEYMTVTFDVDVDQSPSVLQITNTASVTSDQMTQSRNDTVIDPVRVVDLAVFKSVDSFFEPGQGSGVEPSSPQEFVYTVTITNAGNYAATGIEVTEYWPADLVLTNYSVTAGSYDTNTHIWSIATMNPGAAETLMLYAVIDMEPGTEDITNRVAITAIDQYDIDETNNESEIVVATRVVVARFEAGIDDGVPYVEWETASENMTGGFLLHRGSGPDGPWVAVMDRPLPARMGFRQGSVYRYYDAGLSPETMTWYMLEEFELTGQRLMYGPFEVYAAAGVPPAIEMQRDAGAFGAWARPSNVRAPESEPFPMMIKAMSMQTVKGSGGEGVLPEMRILVTRRGMHLLTAAMLAQAAGVMENTVVDNILAGDCGISYRGEPVPVWRDVNGEWIAFYADPQLSLYISADVYRLNWGAAQAPAMLASDVPVAVHDPLTFTNSVLFSEDVIAILSMARSSDDDYWFWKQFMGGQSVELDFVMSDLDVSASGAITVDLHGSWASGGSNEYWVAAEVNGTALGDVQWSGLRQERLVAEIPPGLLIDGTNTLKLSAHLADGISYSYVLLQSFEVQYAALYNAQDGQLICRGGSNQNVTVSGFTTNTLDVISLGEGGVEGYLDTVLTDESGGFWRVSFVPDGAGRDYLVWQSGTGYTPESIELINQAVDLRSRGHVVQYLVIAPEGFEAVAGQWADYRAAQGLKTMVAPLNDIYDQFADGRKDPRAIREMLRYAEQEWGYAPEYVLLAGNGTYDYRNLMDVDVNRIPSIMVPTLYGLTASDNWYVDLDENGIPDMAIGRIPVRSAADLSSMLAKVQAYEADAGDWWGGEILFVSDEKDPAAGDFRKTSDAIMAKTPPPFWPGYSDIDEDGFELAQDVLLDYLSYGCAFVNYFGHGAVSSLANKQILTVSDVDALNNAPRFPVVTIMSCNAADFSIPDYDSLGERMVINPTGGAIAVWGPTRESLNELGGVLADGFYDIVLHDGEPVLGKAVVNALKRFSSKRSARHVLQTYVLFGDPALQVVSARGVPQPYGEEILVGDDWADSAFTAKELDDDEISGWLADPDDDGVPNLLEYVLGRNPKVPDFTPWGKLRQEEAHMPWEHDIVLTYTRRRNIYDVDVFVEVSDDLQTWHSDSYHIVGTTVHDDGNGVTETVHVYIKSPAEDGRHGFMRLRARVR